MALLDSLMRFAPSVEINDYPLVAQASSRNRTITTVQASPRVWQFVVALETPVVKWEEYRDLIEDIRYTNTSQPFSFTLQGSPSAVLVRYQGTLDNDTLASVVVASRSAGDAPNILRVSGLPTSTSNVFRKGDYVQVGNAVRTCRADVSSNEVGDATLTLSESLVSYPPSGTQVVVGEDVQWNNCYFTELPTPSLNYEWRNAVRWSGTFNFIQTRS